MTGLTQILLDHAVAHAAERTALPLVPAQLQLFPEVRYMGSKRVLLPWIFEVLSGLDFESAYDPFSGSGAVSYLLKAMDRRVVSSDFLNMPVTLATALVANNGVTLDRASCSRLLRTPGADSPRFARQTFENIFFAAEDLDFIDRIWANLPALASAEARAVALAALIRSCMKKQPRGVFTISGDLSRYDDGRRDLRLSLEEHFLEQVEAYNAAVFGNGCVNSVVRGDVFSLPVPDVDLVYLDPPYVPRSDDNCYMKRYHFVEGVSCYWLGQEIDYSTKVRKITKPFTPFSYRRTAAAAFDMLFRRFKEQIIVLSYSSNGYPDLEQLEALMRRYKKSVQVFERAHRYHFGTHGAVERSVTTEYLLVGR